MKVRFTVIVLLLAMGRIAYAGCWDDKQDETNKIKEQVIVALENTDPKDWNFATGDDLQYTKTTKNKKEMVVNISHWGTMSIDSQVIDLPDFLRKKVQRLYKKIACVKVFREVLLMKEFLGIL